MTETPVFHVGTPASSPAVASTSERRRPAGRLAAVSAAIPTYTRHSTPPATHAPSSGQRMAFPKQLVPPQLQVSVRSRGYVPHWDASGAIYFLTFRLADALPPFVLDRLRQERRVIELQITRNERRLTALERLRVDRFFFRRLDDALDCGYGSCLLARDEAALIVQQALLFFDRARYDLFAWCVMPTHVHVLARLNVDLARVMHSWTSYSCHEINTALARRGSVWERESYDRLVRNERHFLAVRRYVVANPEKAGLSDGSGVERSL